MPVPLDQAPQAPLETCRVIGIGASAGGIEAIEEFFGTLASDSRLAFVIVQHLSTDFRSLMVELLRRRTSLQVHEAEDGVRPERGAVYLMPPGRRLTLDGERLRLSGCDGSEAINHSIDSFFKSLAASAGAEAIGIILSGSGRDGSEGARAILQGGGRVLVQEPSTARFASMPENAIAHAGLSEIMRPSEMPLALPADVSLPQPAAQGQDHLPHALAEAMRKSFGHELEAYQFKDMMRSINRRMMMCGIDDLGQYAEIVSDDEQERRRLYRDVVMGRRAFPYGTPAFKRFEALVLPRLCDKLASEQELRIWVPAGGSGEEAYTIAMLLLAENAPDELQERVRIFATDSDPTLLQYGGDGVYDAEALANLPEAWSERFFNVTAEGYRVKTALRRLLVFGRHDPLTYPAFAGLDLIDCRLYLKALRDEARERVLRIFSSGLVPEGFLFCPGSEPACNASVLEAVDAKVGIYRKRLGAAVDHAVRTAPLGEQTSIPARSAKAGGLLRRRDQRLSRAYDRLLERYAPASLVIDERAEIIHSLGDTSMFLRLPQGPASLNVIDMVAEPMRPILRVAINRVLRTGRPVIAKNLPSMPKIKPPLQRLVVEALDNGGENDGLLLVSFDRRTEEKLGGGELIALDPIVGERLCELERDLQTSEARLQEAVDRLETSNEELQAINQELMTSSAALSSSNEELHSVNEELRLVSEEYENRIEDLMALADDIETLLEGIDVAALLLDDELRIRRFTPTAARIFNLLEHDRHRPLEHVTHNLQDDRLIDKLETARASGEALRVDVQDIYGRSWTLFARSVGIMDHPKEGLAVLLLPLRATTPRSDVLDEVVKALISPEPAALVDADGVIEACNASMKALLERPAGGWRGLEEAAGNGRSWTSERSLVSLLADGDAKQLQHFLANAVVQTQRPLSGRLASSVGGPDHFVCRLLPGLGARSGPRLLVVLKEGRLEELPSPRPALVDATRRKNS